MVNLNIDWNPIISAILQAVLPILFGALATYLVVRARAEWMQLQATQPDLVSRIQEAASFAYGVVEQLRKSGRLPSDMEAREYAEALVEKYLKAKGIDVDLTPFTELIIAAIEKAVNDNRTVVTTSTVATVQSSPSKVFAPVNTQAGKYTGEVVEKGAIGNSAGTSVVTTTTSSTVSNSGDVVIPVVDSNVSDKDGVG